MKWFKKLPWTALVLCAFALAVLFSMSSPDEVYAAKETRYVAVMEDSPDAILLKKADRWSDPIFQLKFNEKVTWLFDVKNSIFSKVKIRGKVGYVHVRGMGDSSFRHLFLEVLGRHERVLHRRVIEQADRGGKLDLRIYLDSGGEGWKRPSADNFGPTEELKRLLHEAMDAGACGWSSQTLGTPGDPKAPTAGAELRVGDKAIGAVTSAAFHPRLQKSIAMGFVVPAKAE